MLAGYGPMLLLAALGLSAFGLLLSGYLIYKVRQIHVTLYGVDTRAGRLSLELTGHLQTLQLLGHELGLGRPLPVTRGWAASPDVLLVLLRRVRARRPQTVLECGSGISTLVQAQAVRLNGSGHAYSLDHDADFAAGTRAALRDYGLSDWATVIHAPLVEQEIEGRLWRWYDPAALPAPLSIDLLFVDGPPADEPEPLARFPAGPLLLPHLAPGGAVVLDDADRPGEREIVRRWRAAFPGLTLREHPSEKGCLELEAPARPAAEASGPASGRAAPTGTPAVARP